jgi:hypothetical protein
MLIADVAYDFAAIVDGLGKQLSGKAGMRIGEFENRPRSFGLTFGRKSQQREHRTC